MIGWIQVIAPAIVQQIIKLLLHLCALELLSGCSQNRIRKHQLPGHMIVEGSEKADEISRKGSEDLGLGLEITG